MAQHVELRKNDRDGDGASWLANKEIGGGAAGDDGPMRSSKDGGDEASPVVGSGTLGDGQVKLSV